MSEAGYSKLQHLVRGMIELSIIFSNFNPHQYSNLDIRLAEDRWTKKRKKRKETFGYLQSAGDKGSSSALMMSIGMSTYGSFLKECPSV